MFDCSRNIYKCTSNYKKYCINNFSFTHNFKKVMRQIKKSRKYLFNKEDILIFIIFIPSYKVRIFFHIHW